MAKITLILTTIFSFQQITAIPRPLAVNDISKEALDEYLSPLLNDLVRGDSGVGIDPKGDMTRPFFEISKPVKGQKTSNQQFLNFMRYLENLSFRKARKQLVEKRRSQNNQQTKQFLDQHHLNDFANGIYYFGLYPKLSTHGHNWRMENFPIDFKKRSVAEENPMGHSFTPFGRKMMEALKNGQDMNSFLDRYNKDRRDMDLNLMKRYFM